MQKGQTKQQSDQLQLPIAGGEEKGGAWEHGKRVDNYMSVHSPDPQKHSHGPHTFTYPKLNKSPHQPEGARSGM